MTPQEALDDLCAENDKLRAENDKLRAENDELRAEAITNKDFANAIKDIFTRP